MFLSKYLNKISISKKADDIDFVDMSLEKASINLSNRRLHNKKKGDPNANLEELYKDNQKALDDILYYKKNIFRAKLCFSYNIASTIFFVVFIRL